MKKREGGNEGDTRFHGMQMRGGGRRRREGKGTARSSLSDDCSLGGEKNSPCPGWNRSTTTGAKGGMRDVR